jgi:hypothetical protein
MASGASFCERHSNGISTRRVSASAVRFIGCRPSDSESNLHRQRGKVTCRNRIACLSIAPCSRPILRERVAELESTIGRKIVEVRELHDGYALRFPAEAGIVEELGRLIDFERICCAFLNFSLRVKAAGGPIWLELTGSDEAKNFLRPAVERWTLMSAPKAI